MEPDDRPNRVEAVPKLDTGPQSGLPAEGHAAPGEAAAMSGVFSLRPTRPTTAAPNMRSVIVPADSVRDHLRLQGAPLDGGGCMCLWPLREGFVDELFVVYAAPPNALDYPRFSLEIDRFNDGTLVSLIAAVPVAQPVPGAQAVLFTQLDPGKPACYADLAELAERESLGLLNLDSRTGLLLSQSELRLSAHERVVLRSLLDEEPRPMNAAQERTACALVAGRIERRVPWRRIKTGRNDPCGCGSGAKSKRCCHA
jgi:hypothetical protein